MDRRTFLKAGAGVAATSGVSGAGAFAGCGGAHAALRAAGEPRQLRPDLGHAVRRAQRLQPGLGHALRHRQQAAAAAADGRERGGLRRRPDLDLQAARRACKFHDGEPVLAKDVVASLHALGGARRHGPDDQGDPEGAGRRSTTAPSSGCCRSPTRRCCSRSARTTRPCAFIMPERIAKTDPFKQIDGVSSARAR